MPLEQLAIDGGVLVYDLAGPPRSPLVVLAHGIADSRHAFRFLVPGLLKAGFRVAALDIRGCGDSTADWPAYTRTDIANDFVALVRQLGSERPAVIIGHSISGGAATIAAALEPSMFCGLIQLAPFTKEQSMGVADLFRTGVVRLISAVLFSSTRLWLWYLEAAMPGTSRPADWTHERTRIEQKLREPGRMSAVKKMCFSSPADAGYKLKDVRCPVLIIEGSLDCDFADPCQEGEEIIAALPQGLGQIAIVNQAGHYPHFQFPDETLAIVLPFLQRITSQGAALQGLPPQPESARA